MNLSKTIVASALFTALAACSSGGSYHNNDSYSSNNSTRSTNCGNCGVVQNITNYTGERRTTGGGAVVGAVVGGVLGNQVGGGNGKTAATVAGAVVGGVVGNNIEKNHNKTWHEVTVRMSDGNTTVVNQDDLHGVSQGSNVVIRDGQAYLN
jgi:outer membrane lipoprotein SlyB